jgi:hypothetical protein
LFGTIDNMHRARSAIKLFLRQYTSGSRCREGPRTSEAAQPLSVRPAGSPGQEVSRARVEGVTAGCGGSRPPSLIDVSPPPSATAPSPLPSPAIRTRCPLVLLRMTTRSSPLLALNRLEIDVKVGRCIREALAFAKTFHSHRRDGVTYCEGYSDHATRWFGAPRCCPPGSRVFS